MNLRVASLAQARTLVGEGWPTHVVSVVDPDCLVSCPGLLHLVVEKPDGGFLERHGVDAIIAFAQTIPPDARLLVHCHAGISRSPAAAIGILATWGIAPGVAVAEVALARPIMLPDTGFVDAFDEVLALGGTLSSSVRAWVAVRQGM